jgi:hypothetical protein
MQASARCAKPLPQPTPTQPTLPQPTLTQPVLPQPTQPYTNKPGILEQDESL